MELHCRGEKKRMLIDRYLSMRFTAADPESILTRLAIEGIELIKITRVDQLTVEIRIKNRQRFLAHEKLERLGISFQYIKREGVLWIFQTIFKRRVLFLGLLLFFLIALFLPGRVLLVDVVGNEAITKKDLLQQIENAGVCFGVKTSEIRSENVKNILMEKILDLQWVGVTISGSKVIVHVKERSNINNEPKTIYSASNIVATQDGVISEIMVYYGNPLFQVGDTIKAGDVVISGYTDCGIKTVVQRASGEVFAYTRRECGVITPTLAEKRVCKIDEHRCYRLQIGKKVINFCNHSGISGGTCAKMYMEYYWSLPGGFQLPVCFTKIVNVEYNTVTTRENDEAIKWLPEYAREYLRSQMVAGSIMRESIACKTDNDFIELIGSYACHEMIGQEKYEEIVG